jgi:PAS domain S-box-containing protein
VSTGATFFQSAQIRHALRTPLNHIAGYSEMLIEELPFLAPTPAGNRLEAIRARGRAILDLLQAELPPQDTEIGREHLEALKTRLQPELDAITTEVGQLLLDADARAAGLSVPDVLRIGSAVAELLQIASGALEIPSAEPPKLDATRAMSMATGDILVIDDHPSNRDLLTRVLEKQGFQVCGAASGKDGFAELARRRFDLILLDLMMPEMDGVAVLQRLRSDTKLRDVPVIMLSALDETSRVIQSLEMGAEDYVVKPFDPVLLTARLRSTLERSRLREAEMLRASELEDAYEKLRENEQRLQESEERLRLATEAAEVGIWYYYAQSDRVLMTPGCRRLFGLDNFGLDNDDARMSLEGLLERAHPEDRERVEGELRRAIEAESELDIEYRVIWPDGSVRWVSTRGQAKCQGAGPGLGLGSAKETRIAGVALDITGRKQAEEAMRQSAKLESIGLLAGGIAHDFNNLLTGIIGSASFVLESVDKEDPNAEMLRNVVNAGERAADLTKQLLAYSGRGKFTVRKLELSKLVSDIAALLRSSISKRVKIEHDFGDDLPRIEGDSTQIQQIVMNLMINGSEAINGDGVVRVTTGLMALGVGGREDFVLGKNIRPADYVFLEVCDTGCGMEPGVLSRIFEPFFTTKFTGRGLGLAAVFGIVRGHEGAMEVRSRPGEGSTFRVYFPPAAGEPIAGKPKEPGAPVKILFVDDESVVRFMGRTALERAGFQVLLAESGEAAVRLASEHRDSMLLAVIDLTMPGWNGFETYRRLKQIAPDLHCVMSSGFGEEEVRARYPGEQFGPLLKKPYMAATLVTRVKELAEKATSGVRSRS